MSLTKRKYTIGRTFHFDGAHFLPGHSKCGVMHGHTWHVTVEVTSTLHEDTPMVMDLHDLKAKTEELVNYFDHKVANDTVSFPTAENLSYFFASHLLKDLKYYVATPYYITVKVQEGEGGWASVTLNSSELGATL